MHAQPLFKREFYFHHPALSNIADPGRAGGVRLVAVDDAQVAADADAQDAVGEGTDARRGDQGEISGAVVQPIQESEMGMLFCNRCIDIRCAESDYE